MAKISLIMPVYNGELYIQNSIQSILDQTYREFELIIINDGSTDGTEKVIKSFQDPRIFYQKQVNQGKSTARNQGLKLATGEYVIFHDADDVSLACRLAILHDQIVKHPNVDFVHSDLLLINSEGKPIGYWSTNNIHPTFYTRFFLKVGTPFNNGTMMIRRSVLKDEQQDPQLSVGEDTEFLERTLLNKHSVHIALPLYQYRRHMSNESQNIDIDEYIKHIRKMINRYSIAELIPECNWEQEKEEDCLSQAHAIIFLFLFRRGLADEALAHFNIAKKYASSSYLKLFLFSMVYLASDDPKRALDYLNKISNPNHIVYQYRGECYAKLKDWDQAYDCFINALTLHPHYLEPLEHLKALGSGINYHSIDPSYTIYR